MSFSKMKKYLPVILASLIVLLLGVGSASAVIRNPSPITSASISAAGGLLAVNSLSELTTTAGASSTAAGQNLLTGTSYSLGTSTNPGVLGLNTYIANGSTGGLTVWHTSDPTNYENGLFGWSGNTLEILPQKGGTGSLRTFAIGDAANSKILLNSSSPLLQFTRNGTSGAGTQWAELATVSFTGSSGNQITVGISPIWAESGSAGNTGLLIRPNASSTGSGLHPLLRADTLQSSSTPFTVNFQGANTEPRLAIGTSTPAADIHVLSTATSTLYLNSSNNNFGGQIILRDQSGTGCTRIVSNAGALTASVITCP